MLTQTEHKTYQFIKQFMEKYEHAPTSAEIAAGIGIQSRGVVHRYLKSLAHAGYIKLLPNRHRNIILNSLQQLQDSIPLLGYIAAGRPIEAIPQTESISFKELFASPEQFALQVKGDSMINEGIVDGDLVICRPSETARNGEIVVALIDTQEATLKRFHFDNKNNLVNLIPANSHYQAQNYAPDRVQIQGIYMGLIRKA